MQPPSWSLGLSSCRPLFSDWMIILLYIFLLVLQSEKTGRQLDSSGDKDGRWPRVMQEPIWTTSKLYKQAHFIHKTKTKCQETRWQYLEMTLRPRGEGLLRPRRPAAGEARGPTGERQRTAPPHGLLRRDAGGGGGGGGGGAAGGAARGGVHGARDAQPEAGAARPRGPGRRARRHPPRAGVCPCVPWSLPLYFSVCPYVLWSLSLSLSVCPCVPWSLSLSVCPCVLWSLSMSVCPCVARSPTLALRVMLVCWMADESLIKAQLNRRLQP